MTSPSTDASALSYLPDGFTDGLVAVVKRDCPTCIEIVPALVDLASGDEPILILTQDDPAFPDGVDSVDDTDLAFSWHNSIETVPTLLRIAGGTESDRIVGWKREQWQEFTQQADLGTGLAEYRPGCGSLSVDPSRSDELNAKYGATGLRSRRVEFASAEDEFEAMYDRGWSDGLPLIPPTESRVLQMLAGTTRDPDDVVVVAPPDLVECTVEKIAVNAVMAGCKPEYLPVVIAAIEAVCTDEFNMHGLLATTMGVGPVIVVNGPIAKEIGMNHGMNVFGQGNRANATIGRAVQLVIRNVGGGRPGEIDRAAQGNPGKLGLCFPEFEAGTDWPSLAEDRGMAPGKSAVTVFAGEAPRNIVDQLSRSPESLTNTLAEAMRVTAGPRMVMATDAILVLSPEHIARYHDAGWSKERFRDELISRLKFQSDDIIRGAGGIEEGLPAGLEGLELDKFRPDGGLMIAHAGGPAGLFSSVIGGWVSGPKGSIPVTREIVR